MDKENKQELKELNNKLDKLLELDGLLLKAEAAADMMDGFPI